MENIEGVSFGSWLIHPLQSDGGALVFDPSRKAALLNIFFDEKQFRDVAH